MCRLFQGFQSFRRQAACFSGFEGRIIKSGAKVDIDYYIGMKKILRNC